MRKVISFLGTVVRETEYEYQGNTYCGGVFQIALRQFVEFDEMLVFVTKQAREKAFPALEALGDPRIKPVDIDTGTTTAELWNIFGELVDHVDVGDEVVFDLTHGLRSIPFLVFLAAAYLSAAKKVHLDKVLYGALELGRGKPAPVIELTELVILLDWLTAADLFLKTGNASSLAETLAKVGGEPQDALAGSVNEIALGLHVLRPMQVSAAASELEAHLEAAQQKLPPPFAQISDRLLMGYGGFALPENHTPQQCLSRQLDMINWYHSAGQVAHTLSLGREWLVSLLCAYFGADVLDTRARGEVELALSGGSTQDTTTGQMRRSIHHDQWAEMVPEGKRIRRLWGGPLALANVRNDVLHAGFRHNPKSAAEIVKLTDDIVDELNAIAAVWGIQIEEQT